LITSAICHRPLSFGVWQPTIVLPATLCKADRADALRHVLLHEDAHIRQRDAVGGLLINMALPVLYFHPLYWWVRSQGQMAAELIADDQAAGRTNRHTYAEVLVALARGCGQRWPLPLGATGVFDSQTQFYRRMEMLLQRKASLATRCSSTRRTAYLLAFVAVVGLLAITAGAEPIVAQDDENDVEVTAFEIEEEENDSAAQEGEDNEGETSEEEENLDYDEDDFDEDDEGDEGDEADEAAFWAFEDE